MEDLVKNQITLAEFESIGAKFSANNTKRSYFDALKHITEYENASLIDKKDYETIVLEAVVDKSAIDDFIKLLTKYDFPIYNNKDLPYLLNMKERIMDYPKTNKVLSDLASLENSIEKIGNEPLYKVNEEEDATIYFVPFNNKVSNIHDFFKVYRDIFYDFALANDLTIILKTKDRKNKLDGFIAFNFLDTNEKNEIVSYKYAIRVVLKSKANDPISFIEEALILNAIGKNKVELDEVNTIISKE